MTQMSLSTISTIPSIVNTILRRPATAALRAMSLVFLATATFLCIGSVVANAQNGTISGRIYGFALDTTGKVIVNASMTATDVLTSQRHTEHTDDTGQYQFLELPVGTYDVKSEQTGFTTVVHTGIIVYADSNNRVDFTLHVGAQTQQVTVSAAVTQVNTESAEVGQTITGKELEDLPLNGRTSNQLVTLVPGNTGYALSTNNGMNTYSLDSAGSYFQNAQTEWLLDGGVFDWTQVNRGGTLPNPDALAEFHYGLMSRSAEYGRQGDATINAVIKSGTNQFHGDVWEFNRNNGLDARPYLSSATNPRLVQNQFGLTFGGPILRNKAFFFGSYEGLRQYGSGFTADIPVLTAQERTGNFSDAVPNITHGQLTNPVTGVSYAGNVVPVNPVSANIMAWVPAPNTVGPSGVLNEWTGEVPNQPQPTSISPKSITILPRSITFKGVIFIMVVQLKAHTAVPSVRCPRTRQSPTIFKILLRCSGMLLMFGQSLQPKSTQDDSYFTESVPLQAGTG